MHTLTAATGVAGLGAADHEARRAENSFDEKAR